MLLKYTELLPKQPLFLLTPGDNPFRWLAFTITAHMTEIPKAYDPAQVEPVWYQAWLDAGAFRSSPVDDREAYCIVIPPPNVTGVLTIGHVLNNTIQDILVRRARLQGKEAMWLPGTDHASIATHARVETQLRAEGTSRRELGREKFIERTWEWSRDHGGKILGQISNSPISFHLLILHNMHMPPCIIIKIFR